MIQFISGVYAKTPMKAVVVGDEHTVYTFRLLGFEGRVVKENENPLYVIKELCADEDVGVVIVTDNLVEKIRDEFNRMRMKLKRPILVEIPSLKEVKLREVNYLAILRSVLGI